MSETTKVININGALVAFYPISGLKAVGINAKIKAGSWYEPQGDVWGKAHLLEHMMFQGTNKFKDRDSMEEFKEENGIWSNAGTSGSQVDVTMRMPGKSISAGMELMEEMLFNIKIAEDSLDKQKKVVSQEYEDKFSKPRVRFWEKSMKQRFGENHLYVRDGIGKPDCFKVQTSGDLMTYMKKHFVPSNMVIAVAGKFDVDEVTKLLEKVLPKSETGEIIEFEEVRTNKERLVHFEAEMTTATISLGWMTRGLNDVSFEERVKLSLASYLFGGSTRSVLFREIRERLCLAYSASSRTDYYPTVGFFDIETSVKKENVEKTIEEVKKLLLSFTDSQIDRTIFERAKKYLIMQKEMAFESAIGTASSLSNALFWDRRIVSTKEYSEILEETTEDEARKTLRNIVAEKQPIEAIMMSKD